MSSPPVLDVIPEDRPAASEWMPRSISLRRWWDVMTLRSGTNSSQEGGSSTRGVEAGHTGGPESVPSDEAEIRGAASDVTTPVQPVNESRRPCGTGLTWGIIALVVVVLLGVALGVFFATSPSRNTDMDEPQSSSAPTSAPAPQNSSPQSPEDRAIIDSLLISISGDALTDVTTAQSRARYWLLFVDDANLSIAVHGRERVAQRYALGVIYYALDGYNWNTTEFLTPDHECNWTGITCDDSELVLKMDLSNLGLRGVLPHEIGELRLLEVLWLSENAISGRIPLRLWELAFLFSIDIGMNELTGTVSPLMWDLPFLEFLFLNSNNLNGTLPELPEVVPPLKQIWLHENSMVGSLPSSLSRLVHLEALVLYDNEFNSELELPDFTKLYYFDVGWNQFTGSFPDLASLTSLKFLYLNNNSLTGRLDRDLAELPQLQEVWLQSNKFTGTIPDEWSELQNLTALRLNDNELSGSVPEGICNLTVTGRLIVLEVDCNETTAGDAFVNCSCCTECH